MGCQNIRDSTRHQTRSTGTITSVIIIIITVLLFDVVYSFLIRSAAD